jgi:hypothetical protein
MRAWIRATHALYDPANKEEMVNILATTLKIRPVAEVSLVRLGSGLKSGDSQVTVR